MKNLYLLILIVSFGTLVGQNVPQSVNYQSVIRSNNGAIIPNQSIECMKGSDYFFVDAFSEDYGQIEKLFLNINEEIPENFKDTWYHMDMTDAKRLSKKINAKKTFTVHMSHLMSKHSDLVKKYQNDNFIIGYDNFTIDL